MSGILLPLTESPLPSPCLRTNGRTVELAYADIVNKFLRISRFRVAKAMVLASSAIKNIALFNLFFT